MSQPAVSDGSSSYSDQCYDVGAQVIQKCEKRSVMEQKVIFLSYRRDDSPGYVKSLEKELEEHYGPGSVFRDVKDIAGGSKWKKVIEHNLRNAAVLLLIIGPRWDSIWRERIDDEVNYVEYELNFAHKLNVPVIPVTLSGSFISDSTDLKSVSWLRENQSYDMSDTQGRWENDFKGLLSLLEKIKDIDKVRSRAHTESVESIPKPEPATGKKGSKLKTALAIVGALFLALFIIGIFVPEEQPESDPVPQVQVQTKGTNSQSPGFDCSNAGTQIERIICENPDIARIDNDLNVAYGALSAQLNQEQIAKLKSDQREWLKQRNQLVRNTCLSTEQLDTGCVVDIYRQRVDWLEQMAVRTQNPATPQHPDLTGTWRSNNYRTIYLVEQFSDSNIKISGYADGEARFLKNVPNKILVELYGLGKGEFSVSNSSDRIMGSMNYYDGTVEYDTLVKIQ